MAKDILAELDAQGGRPTEDQAERAVRRMKRDRARIRRLEEGAVMALYQLLLLRDVLEHEGHGGYYHAVDELVSEMRLKRSSGSRRSGAGTASP